MDRHIISNNFITPEYTEAHEYNDATEAVDALTALYEKNVGFLRKSFEAFDPKVKQYYRAFYPEICISCHSFEQVDSRLSFGHFSSPGVYSATITNPQLFRSYLIEQLSFIGENHDTVFVVGESETPIPLHFAITNETSVNANLGPDFKLSLRDYFDTPDLSITDDSIVNGTQDLGTHDTRPLAPFTAQRVDYSLARLAHYTATNPEHYQNFVLFTNYQFYIDEFSAYAKKLMAEGGGGYESFVEPGNIITTAGEKADENTVIKKMPQMPAYHLTKKGHGGITMVNIGVGPSNAKTITDHVAVLRPHVWLMLGHCAGLRNSQRLGDYVLAHAYVREDHVLDSDLPVWVPIPALAEVQVALQDAVAEVTGYDGYDLKRIMRTGTVATIDNRNWELRDQKGPVQRLSQSRAVALDMESATIAANGFRFRVPYGTLLCVSDKPLHGELKLPGMASDFYRTQVDQHLRIGIRTMELLSQMPSERLHSRKLRSFAETAFQ